VKSKTKLNKKSVVKRLKDFAAHSKLKSQHLRNLLWLISTPTKYNTLHVKQIAKRFHFLHKGVEPWEYQIVCLSVFPPTTPCWASAAGEDYRTCHVKRNSFPCYQQPFSIHTIHHLQFSCDHHCQYSADQVLEMHNLHSLHCNQLLEGCMQEHHHLHLRTT